MYIYYKPVALKLHVCVCVCASLFVCIYIVYVYKHTLYAPEAHYICIKGSNTSGLRSRQYKHLILEITNNQGTQRLPACAEGGGRLVSRPSVPPHSRTSSALLALCVCVWCVCDCVCVCVCSM